MTLEDLTRKVEELTRELDETKNTLATHGHGGNDGSERIYNDSVVSKPGQGIGTGFMGMADLDDPANGRQLGVWGVGKDTDASNGFQNAQITIDHQSPSTDGTTNQTFIHGLRGNLLLTQTGSVISGESILTADILNVYNVNDLAGHFIIARHNSSGATYDGFTIASNRANTLTINGSWTFTNSATVFDIFVPIYFGAAQYPWRRLYTTGGSAGGIRFGLGHTAGGQNGMLYLNETTGRLQFRRPNGTIDTV